MDLIALAAKKALGALLCPVGVCLALLFAALFFWRRTPKGRLSPSLVLLAAAWLLITSLPIASYFIMRPLENMAGPTANPRALKKLGVEYILVLGGGGSADWRVVEGIRLFRQMPNTRLILSGGRDAQVDRIGEFPIEMGVPKEDLIVQTQLFDTEDEARSFGKIVGKKPFALVTSPYHIPRAMRLFRTAGLNPVAAPCEYRAKRLPAFPSCLLPNADALLTTQLAIHEYLGLAWHAVKERLQGVSRPRPSERRSWWEPTDVIRG
ncbi:MAG: YdcF family protein [Desulfomonilaceae bacterium]